MSLFLQFELSHFLGVFTIKMEYTTQNLIRAKILILFAGGYAYLIPKIL